MSRSRKNIRLKGFNYSSNGSYFITICTIERKLFFGEVLNMEVVLNDVGEMAKRFWKGVPAHFPNVSLDRYVIMPNHIHGIVIINHKNKFESVGTCHGMSLPSIRDGSVGPRHGVALHDDGESEHQIQKCQNQFSKPIPESLSVIINQYKAAVKSGCNKNGHADFYWQPRFYDHYNK